MPIDTAAFEGRLRARREELRHFDVASRGERAPVELDQTRVGRLSRMDALQVQAMAIETGRRRSIELARIEAALARLAAGDFGACASCGEDIAPARLDADPTAPLCIDCAGARTT